MSDKPSAAWYLAPIFLGIIGSAIMWFVLKDEDHPDAPKMVKKGWIIGIVLTLISFAWIPLMLIPFAFMGMGQQQMHQQVPETIPRLIQEPVQQKVPAPGFEDVPEMIVESEPVSQQPATPDPREYCSGSAACFTGYVTEIIDGDTIRVDGNSIRFALIDTPEAGEYGYGPARDFVGRICPVGSSVLVDEDDLQTQGSYGRMIAVIYCNEMNLNKEVLDRGYAGLITDFCSKSEFSSTLWAQQHGCAEAQQEKAPQTKTQTTQTKQNQCDPSYPDVCIPPYPPDLDCGEISYKNFRVSGLDPHGFDGDGDGIGCEG